MMLSVVVNFQWPAPILLVSFAELLEPPLHCTIISSSWAKCVVDGVSYLRCFMVHFDPFGTEIRKSPEFAFCLDISLVPSLK